MFIQYERVVLGRVHTHMLLFPPPLKKKEHRNDSKRSKKGCQASRWILMLTWMSKYTNICTCFSPKQVICNRPLNGRGLNWKWVGLTIICSFNPKVISLIRKLFSKQPQSLKSVFSIGWNSDDAWTEWSVNYLCPDTHWAETISQGCPFVKGTFLFSSINCLLSYKLLADMSVIIKFCCLPLHQ